MQTFLPYPDFQESARCLDRQRLGKQRVEAYQLLSTVFTGRGGWSKHPAARMWRGFESALALYGIEICREWIARGYRDTCYEKIRHLWAAVMVNMEISWKGDIVIARPNLVFPNWFGNERFHSAHRSNLLRKNPEHYGKFGWQESDDLSYYWPA